MSCTQSNGRQVFLGTYPHLLPDYRIMTLLEQPLGPARSGILRVARWSGLLVLLLVSRLFGAEYRDHTSQTEQLRKLAGEHSDLVRLTEQALTVGKREVWLVELGFGTDAERKRTPALLVVAGIEVTT